MIELPSNLSDPIPTMSDELLYARIAERFSFQMPPEYRRLRERGWLTYNQPPGQISTTPGNGYIWLNEMEWYPLEEIAEFSFPEYGEPYLPHLVPFAFTGGGDYWCWQTDHGGEGGPRILLCAHDCYDGEIYAPNFATALYRQALEYAAGPWDESDTTGDEPRAHLRRYAHDLALIFPHAWCALLAELASRPLQERQTRWGPHRWLLPTDELRSIESRDLGLPLENEAIRWMALGQE
jgi:hypothetical protein